MAYSSFTLRQVQSQFGLKVDKGVFFRDVPPLIPRQRTIEAMAESAPFAATQGSEKVLSELIIAPLLFELRSLLDGKIGLFSGMDFSIDPGLGLNGICDFLLTRSSNELLIEAPAIVLIEAKKADLIAAWGQCAAEMVAAQKFNLSMGKEIAVIYGSVTTGMQWQFLKLSGTDLTIDTTQYPLDPLDRILGILKWMLEK
jgi:hypothetical protein